MWEKEKVVLDQYRGSDDTLSFGIGGETSD